MATTACCDVIEPHQEFVNVVHKHHHPSGVRKTSLIFKNGKLILHLDDKHFATKILIILSIFKENNYPCSSSPCSRYATSETSKSGKLKISFMLMR